MGLLDRVDALRTEERGQERDDGYDFYISSAVYESLKPFIPIMERFPAPHLALPGDSGIVFSFPAKGSMVGRCVRVAFCGNGTQYVYYENGNEYNAIDLNEATLTRHLKLLFASPTTQSTRTASGD